MEGEGMLIEPDAVIMTMQEFDRLAVRDEFPLPNVTAGEKWKYSQPCRHGKTVYLKWLMAHCVNPGGHDGKALDLRQIFIVSEREYARLLNIPFSFGATDG
jgi:hypothetical protein